ncbi:MAG: nucleoside transporter C-terminal domain-containing protein [Planctomycetia bacterium]|nr:nucleoside transporter C-terminal domain-containing protein [Planctomycetia bacterium]
MERLISFLGIFIILFIAWCCSENRRKMDWRLIATGMLLQFAIALLLFQTEIGTRIFGAANAFFTKLIQFSNEGAIFVFGENLVKTTLAFSILPTVIFVSTLSGILFYLGILQKLIAAVAWIMVRVMNVSGLESLAASANVYIGMTEAPIIVRPYLATATRSEILAIMSSGMATIAGGVMAAYIGMGASAGHLLTASLMSAPAALVIAKILIPETEDPLTRGTVRIHPPKNSINLLDAACRGASDGLGLALNIGVMLLAAVSLISLCNWFFTIFPEINGSALTLQRIFGWFFAPFAFIMGVPSSDILTVGSLLGEKTVLNEFIAYVDLTELHKQGLLSARGFIIAQYALCGFANFGSMAIMVGGISQLVPERRDDLARLALRSLIVGTLASFCTACVAGIFI